VFVKRVRENSYEHDHATGTRILACQAACRRMKALTVLIKRMVSGWLGDGTMRCSGIPSNVRISVAPLRL
jgi:hypothetical protein